MVLIVENHIPIHTFPYNRHVNTDIFSCKDFDRNAAEKIVSETFDTKELRTWLMERGVDYDHPRTLYSGVVRDRVELMERNRNQ
mgnify:CR=1 FL=1